jgi:isopentenyl diphosphate isomerase/L-lactate dehydrogenase-like FMN-dependent dehydrogenase
VEPEPVNIADFERVAEQRLEPAAWGYFSGGAGDERTLRDNVEAWSRWQLRPRLLVDVGSTSAATTVLGTPVALPLLVAPMAYLRVAHPDGEPALARAAAAAGTVFCLSTLASASPDQVAAAAPGGPRWFQLYVFTDRGLTDELVAQAIDAGCSAIVLTVDLPVVGRREREVRTGWRTPEELVPALVAARARGAVGDALALFDATLSWRDLERLAAASSVPVLVKGILGPEDARLAVEHGAAGIVVSNHGGRQLDGVPACADALVDVVDAVEGKVEVLVDGGVRRGTDVVKALALGARAVLAGRAPLWGLVAGGEAGARQVLDLLRLEIENALALAGCPRPDTVTREHVRPAPHR